MRDYEPYYTEDGSIGLYSFADKDVYHSKYGALTEAWEKFVLPSKVNEILNTKKTVNVLDICYGIGYNTKALMSYTIANNKNKITKKNIFQKIYLKIKKIKNSKNNKNIETIHTDNTQKNKNELSSCNETIYSDNILPLINIDCIDINEELVKLSPFFKTLKTPEEIFSYFVPDLFDCFKLYYVLRNIFANMISVFYPKNRKEISDLLEIKFKNMHIEKEYKVNKIVNYMLINKLSDKYGKEYIDKNIKKILQERKTSKFFDKSYVKYAKFNQFCGYKSSSGSILSTFLHNIYYHHLSKRHKNIDFKVAERLFNINYLINDARKSIVKINTVYDCIFLDAFTYTKSAQLWSVEFVAELTKRLSETGVLLTYSNSAQIRNTFIENGLYVGKIYNPKTDKYNGTIASKDKSKIEFPLNNYELGLCSTKAGIPYHDPNLAFPNKDIMELREYEFRHSNLMSSSKYMKMRSMRGDDE